MGFAIIGKYLPLTFVSSIALYNFFKGCLKLTKRCNWSINCQYVLVYQSLLQKMSLTGIPIFFCLLLKSSLWPFPIRATVLFLPPCFLLLLLFLFFTLGHRVIKQHTGIEFDQLQKFMPLATHPVRQVTCISKYLYHCFWPKIIILIYLGLLC